MPVPYELGLQKHVLSRETPVVGRTKILWLEQTKEEKRDDPLNVINFVANTAKAMVDTASPERFDEQFRGVINDITSYVAEHPLAETVGQEVRSLMWVIDGQRYRPKVDASFLDDVVKRALVSSQPLVFEFPRYAVNSKNLEELTANRSLFLLGNNQSQQEDFVEFSPAPVDTAQARKRGYLGKSYISIFHFDTQTQTDTVTQYWVNTDWKQFTQFISELTRQQITYLSDVGIMEQSRFFSAQEIEKLKVFIDKHATTRMANYELERYVQTELKEYLKAQLEPVLIQGAHKLLYGLDIGRELQEITSTLLTTQEFMLKKKIWELTGKDLRKIRVTAEVERRLYTNPEYRMMYVQEKTVPFSGCGGGINKDDPFGLNGPSLANLIKKFTNPINGLDTNESYSFDHHGKCVKCEKSGMLGPCNLCEKCDKEFKK